MEFGSKASDEEYCTAITDESNPLDADQQQQQQEKESNEPRSSHLGNTVRILDLAFAMDCTGSMNSYIEQARQNIKAIAEDIVRLEKVNLNLALVEYRDHPPEDKTFVTRVLNFTSSVQAMKARLDSCSAQGGGDGPEAVADALYEVHELSWRSNATKICVLVSDAPPHGLDCSGDAFPSGCPCGPGRDPMKTGRSLAEKGVTIYVVGCEPSITPYRDWFTALAHLTGGQYVPLASARTLPQIIVGGTQEEMSLQYLMQDVESEVSNFDLTSLADGSVSQTQVVQTLFDKLRSRGAKSKHLVSSKGELAGPSTMALELSEKGSMAQVRLVIDRSGGSSWAAPSATADTEYLAVEDDVSYEQAARLVQRSLMSAGPKE